MDDLHKAYNVISVPAFTHYLELLKEMSKPTPAFDFVDISEDGGRKSAKTTQSIKFSCTAMIMFPNECDVEAFRWLKGDDADELFDEFIDNMEELLDRPLLHRKELNYSKRTIRLNGNKIQVRGVNSANKRKKVKMVGVKRAKGKKFLIKVFEERYEFSDDEILGINQALGGYKHVVEIKITNPHSLAYTYIKDLDDEFPHSRQVMSTKGEQFSFKVKREKVDEDLDLMQTVWRIIHYTNWRVNPFLSKADIISIKEAHKYSKNKADVADFGLPAVEEGAIYGEEFPKVIVLPRAEIMKRYKIKSIACGIDLGNGSEADSSATAMEVVAQGSNGESIYLYEHYNHNKDGYVSNTQHAKQIVNEVLDLAKQYPVIRNYINNDGFVFHSDWDFSFIEMLETAIIEKNVDDYFEVQQARKHNELARIEIRKYKMGAGKYIVAAECIHHLRELEIQKWDDTRRDKNTGRHLQMDADNHTTDSGDYAEAESAFDVFEEAQFKLLNKNVKLKGRMR